MRRRFMSRNYTCSRGWVAAVGFLCAVFLAPEQSAACSCVCDFPTWGFVSGGGLIPSNSPGLLWWGEFKGSNGTDQNLPVQIARRYFVPEPLSAQLPPPAVSTLAHSRSVTKVCARQRAKFEVQANVAPG